jgi:hypothetical protein
MAAPLPPLFVVVARGGQFGCHLMFLNTGGIFYGDHWHRDRLIYKK